MAPHSSTLAWKIPWTEEPGRLQSMGSHRVGHNWATSLSLFTFMHWRRKWQPTPVFFLTLQYCIGFAIYQHESIIGICPLPLKSPFTSHIIHPYVKKEMLDKNVKITLLLLLLSRFSHVWLCATPETAAHQAFPSLGFPRQEHWSGLAFPSPMHKSEKWKGSRSVVSDS